MTGLTATNIWEVFANADDGVTVRIANGAVLLVLTPDEAARLSASLLSAASDATNAADA